MTSPSSEQNNGVQAQVLIKLGEIAVDVGVIKSQMAALPEIEKRLREVELAQAETQGQRDWWARAIAAIAALAAIGAVISAYIPHR